MKETVSSTSDVIHSLERLRFRTRFSDTRRFMWVLKTAEVWFCFVHNEIATALQCFNFLGVYFRCLYKIFTFHLSLAANSPPQFVHIYLLEQHLSSADSFTFRSVSECETVGCFDALLPSVFYRQVSNLSVFLSVFCHFATVTGLTHYLSRPSIHKWTAALPLIKSSFS